MINKKFSYKSTQGLPGGANELKKFITGSISVTGYKSDSPDVDNDFNIIPSNRITMEDVEFPVLGIDNLGNEQMMMPGGEYTFPGDYVTELPQMGKGGLTQWFAEDWRDVKTGKKCGRSGKKDKRRSYPACRPSKRVNETTPKTTKEMSSAELAKFKREKKSGKRIDYNHERTAKFGGQTGWLDTYQDGGTNSPVTKLSSQEEEQFNKFFRTLPLNLKVDNNSYDVRGYWDALRRPSSFDYNQPKEEDGVYHAFSRHPRSGKMLKSMSHPTAQMAIEGDKAAGYSHAMDPNGNVYSFSPKDMPTEGPYSFQYGGHSVRPGETFYGIANKYGLGRQDLVQANPNINIDKLQVGQRIALPEQYEGEELMPGYFETKDKSIFGSTVKQPQKAAAPAPKAKPINIEGLKKGIAEAESRSGKLMINPESTATGLYGQRFSELMKAGLYKGTRKQFAKDTAAQNKIFQRRLKEGITSNTGLLQDANDLYEEYAPQIDNFDYSKEDLVALSNFLGRQGTRNYLGYHVRDKKPLSQALPNIYGSKAKQANKTPQQYLNITRKYYKQGGQTNWLENYN